MAHGLKPREAVPLRRRVPTPVYESAADAVASIESGASVMVGGFGGSGTPTNLLNALAARDVGGLTFVANNVGAFSQGIAPCIDAGQAKKVICSFPAGAHAGTFAELYAEGKIELELVPQGTLAERIRAGGAGIPAFFTPTAVGTQLAEGKEKRVIDDRECVLESGLVADFTLARALVADTHGNLVFRKAMRNFNPAMIMAGRESIVEVEEIVEAGELDPETIVTPGIFVNGLVVRTPDGEDGG